MARARNIKPSFFANDALGELEPIARLLFIGMWTIADFKGCIEYRPKRIKVQLLPYDNCDIEKLAINLERSGFILIYSVQSQSYIKIIGFEKHQNPHKNEREAGSEIPDIPENYKEINGLGNIQINREQDGTAPAESLFPLPDSLNPLPDSLQQSRDKPATRATKKCPDTFQLTTGLMSWVTDECPLVDVDLETQTFRDHTFTRSITDWPATWRNWMRKANSYARERRPTKSQPVSFKQSDAEAGMLRWEEMTGRQHPDRVQQTGHVIDITPKFQEIGR